MKYKRHLTEDEITIAAVDRADLGRAAREHLAQCRDCSRRLEELIGGLTAIGSLARRATPDNRLGARPESWLDRFIRAWRPAAAGLVAAGLLVAGVWLWPGHSGSPARPGPDVARQPTDARQSGVALVGLDSTMSDFHDFVVGPQVSTLQGDFGNFLVAQTDRNG